MKAPNPIKQLQCLNNILALATGTDPYFCEQIAEALRFQGHAQKSSRSKLASIAKPASTLLKVHLTDKRSIPFHHWHLEHHDLGPLWIRAQIEAKLKIFEGHSHGLMLITGLSPYVCPEGKRWSRKSKQDYRELLALIQRDTAKFTPSETHLHLICI